MRHRVRRNWQTWADIGAGRMVVDMIRNGVRVPFKSGPPAPFHQGVISMEDATYNLLRFMDGELARFLASGVWEEGHGRAQFLFLAIKVVALFYLRELHDVLRTKNSWSGRVKMAYQLRRDLEWWIAVPSHSNGRSIHKLVETAYVHLDSSGYGYGAVLNENTEARGFWHDNCDRDMHITYKEHKAAVRYAVLTFLSELRELRKLWLILDSNDISIRPRYIKTAANVTADCLSREIDYDDWAFSRRHLNHLDNIWGRHTIDRFATMENSRLPRYNSLWLDPGNEATDSMRLSNGAWCRKHNWCKPP
eukprot:jgi/Tetstr1/455967/TSEL_042748.t1